MYSMLVSINEYTLGENVIYFSYEYPCSVIQNIYLSSSFRKVVLVYHDLENKNIAQRIKNQRISKTLVPVWNPIRNAKNIF